MYVSWRRFSEVCISETVLNFVATCTICVNDWSVNWLEVSDGQISNLRQISHRFMNTCTECPMKKYLNVVMSHNVAKYIDPNKVLC